MTEHDEGLAACTEAIQLISSLGAGSSFIQLKGRIKAVSKKLESMTHLNEKYAAYAPLISSLSQIASNAPPGVVTQIIGLIKALK